MAFWSTILGAPGRPRLMRAGAAAILALLAVGAGGAVGLNGNGSSHHGSVSVGSSAPSTLAPVRGGTTLPTGSTANIATTTTTTTTKTKPGGSTATTSQPNGTSPTSAPAAASTTTTTAGTRPGPQQLPPPGTYTYETKGTYSLSASVFHENGSYPSPTHITVAEQGCGETETWTANSNSSQQTYVCPATGGLRVYYQQSTQYSTTQRFNCTDAFIPITTGTIGQKWHFTCTSSPAGTTAKQVVTFEGHEAKRVGSTTVDTVKVEVDSTFSGTDSGTAQTTYWFSSNATPVEETGNINVKSSNPSGTYTSDYTLTLTDLQPS